MTNALDPTPSYPLGPVVSAGLDVSPAAADLAADSIQNGLTACTLGLIGAQP
jgi:hypothetical protein